MAEALVGQRRGVLARPLSSAAVDRRRLGIVNPETWAFMHSLHESFHQHYDVVTFAPRAVRSPVFRERLARSLLNRDLRRFLERHDVVFFEWASEMLVRATHLPKAARIVTRLHRYELYAWADRVNWEGVDRIILVSEAKRREFVARFQAHAAKTVVIPAAVSLPMFSARDRRSFSGVVGTLCHIHPRKRIYDLILAFAQALETIPSLHLRIGGDPDPAHRDYFEAIMRLVTKLGLESKVTFDGPVQNPWDWYPNVDVFVSHSYSEGLQVAAMEAMAAGCLVLSHAWDGADELVPAECLYVTDAELARKVEELCRLNERDRAARCRAMQDLAARHFDNEKVNERVRAVIDECMTAA